MAQDLQAVGIQAPDPSQDPASILRGLSQGPAAQAAQNPMMGLAAGLSGFNAGFHGQANPVVQQVYQADDAHRRNQVAQFEILNAVQRQRRQFVQDQRNVALDLLRTDVPAARTMGAQLMARGLKESGIELPPNFENSLASGHLSLDKRKEAYVSITAGASDEYLTNQLGVPKESVVQLRQEAKSPAIHKMIYGQTPQQEALALQKSDLDQRKFDLLERRQDLADVKAAQKEKKDDAAMVLAERRFQIAENNQALAQRKFDYLVASQGGGPEEKRQKGLDHADLFVSQFEAYAGTLDKEGFLPKGRAGVVGGLLTGDPSAAAAKANRALFPNDPTWVAFSKHLKSEMVGYMRSVQNDIGPRAMMAFQSGMSIMDDPPSLDAIKKVTTTMRQAIQMGREGKDTAQSVLIRHPNGSIGRVPWKRGMTYDPGDFVVGVE